MKKRNITEYAAKNSYDGADYVGKWNGWDVYEPYFDDEDVHFIGLPLKILVKGNEIRMTTGDEAMEILRGMN